MGKKAQFSPPTKSSWFQAFVWVIKVTYASGEHLSGSLEKTCNQIKKALENQGKRGTN
jgi:hypothetical protein